MRTSFSFLAALVISSAAFAETPDISGSEALQKARSALGTSELHGQTLRGLDCHLSSGESGGVLLGESVIGSYKMTVAFSEGSQELDFYFTDNTKTNSISGGVQLITPQSISKNHDEETGEDRGTLDVSDYLVIRNSGNELIVTIKNGPTATCKFAL